jgi:hypothetical protein
MRCTDQRAPLTASSTGGSASKPPRRSASRSVAQQLAASVPHFRSANVWPIRRISALPIGVTERPAHEPVSNGTGSAPLLNGCCQSSPQNEVIVASFRLYYVESCAPLHATRRKTGQPRRSVRKCSSRSCSSRSGRSSGFTAATRTVANSRWGCHCWLRMSSIANVAIEHSK